MAKRTVRTRESPRKNTPLLLLLLILLPLFGGYYNFSVFLSGAALAALLLYEALRAGALTLPAGPEAWCLYGLWACTLLTVPAAVSRGMALAGALRVTVWALFFLYAATYSPEEREDILDCAAYEGAVLSLISIVSFLYQSRTGLEDRNGRIDGPFQYANTWALFLLACLLLLALRGKRRAADYPAMAALLCGIWLSGSRGVFLLALVLALACGVWCLRRRRALPALAWAGAALASIGISALLSGGMVLERLRAITLSSSSLNGRLLYDLDGLRMLLRHPLGVGRGGYLYIQSLEQTGVYTLRYIHNEYLQAALDGGIPAGLCLAGLAVCLLVRKNAPLRERAVVFAVAAHALIDFDLQFTAVAFLLLLCGSGGHSRRISLSRKALRPAARAVCAGLVLLMGYCSIAYYLDFASRPAVAFAMLPGDLTLAENRLQSFSSVEDAEPAADRILSGTDMSMLAWDCKFAACARRGDIPGMAEAKYQYLRLNRYRGEVYEEFTALLERAWAQGTREQRGRYRVLARSVIRQLEEVNANTSPLAYRIADRPELAFSADILARLQIIEEKTEESS